MDRCSHGLFEYLINVKNTVLEDRQKYQKVRLSQIQLKGSLVKWKSTTNILSAESNTFLKPS